MVARASPPCPQAQLTHSSCIWPFTAWVVALCSSDRNLWLPWPPATLPCSSQESCPHIQPSWAAVTGFPSQSPRVSTPRGLQMGWHQAAASGSGLGLWF